MPIYEYECTNCGHHHERMQKFNDPPLQECPDCHGPVRKLLTPAGIIFKGSGWYITDSRKSSSAATTTNGKSKESKDTTESGGKETTEKKPAEPAAKSDPS